MPAELIPPCKKCGGSMPAPALDQVYVTCSYCGHLDVAPPPLAQAWLAHHYEIVREPTRQAAQARLVNQIILFGFLAAMAASLVSQAL